MDDRNLLTDPRFHFTVSWFLNTVQSWRQYIQPLIHKNVPIRVLEVGCFEGMSAVWMVENFLQYHMDSHITCIDPFTGSEEHTEEQKNALYDRFCKNVVTNFPKKVTVLREYSTPALTQLGIKHQGQYDIIYIDGDHHAAQVYQDIMLSWPLLSYGGIMIIDDYCWDYVPYDSPEHPRPGIDAFLRLHSGKYQTLFSGYQLILQKINV